MPPKKAKKTQKEAKEEKKTQKKKKELFEASATRASKVPYAGKQMYYTYVKATRKASYDDMKKYIEKIRNDMKPRFPDAMMNVAIKYSSKGNPVSAGFQSITDELVLKAPYDYQSEEDPVEGFFIQFTR